MLLPHDGVIRWEGKGFYETQATTGVIVRCQLPIPLHHSEYLTEEDVEACGLCVLEAREAAA